MEINDGREETTRGSILHFKDAAATADLKTPTSGKRLRINSFFFGSTADIVVELRFKTSGYVIGVIYAKGSCGMNMRSGGLNTPTGAADELVEIYLSGAGTVDGWFNYEEV